MRKTTRNIFWSKSFQYFFCQFSLLFGHHFAMHNTQHTKYKNKIALFNLWNSNLFYEVLTIELIFAHSWSYLAMFSTRLKVLSDLSMVQMVYGSVNNIFSEYCTDGNSVFASFITSHNSKSISLDLHPSVCVSKSHTIIQFLYSELRSKL